MGPTLLASTLSVLVFGQSPPASPAPRPRPPACTEAGHREFDFWIGLWDVTNPSGKFVGTNRIESVHGGCALHENWTSAAGGFGGSSLNSVGTDRRWHQTWVDSAGQRLDLSGGIVDGKMVLEGDTPAQTAGGTPTRNRITWSREPGGRVRQLWQASSDAGKTWSVAFDGLYHPVATGKSAVDRQDGSAAPDFLRSISGVWVGEGSVMKRSSHVTLEIRPLAGQTAFELRWANVAGDSTPTEPRALFEGVAIYRSQGGASYAGTWWDSQGARHEIVGSVEGGALTALWGESGKTVYQLLDSGELDVLDSVKKKDGTWSEFGRNRLRRK